MQNNNNIITQTINTYVKPQEQKAIRQKVEDIVKNETANNTLGSGDRELDILRMASALDIDLVKHSGRWFFKNIPDKMKVDLALDIYHDLHPVKKANAKVSIADYDIDEDDDFDLDDYDIDEDDDEDSINVADYDIDENDEEFIV